MSSPVSADLDTHGEKQLSKPKKPKALALAPVAAPDPEAEERRIAEERRVFDKTVRTTGSKHVPFQNQMVQSVIEAQWHHPKASPEQHLQREHAAFQAMRALAPADEVEAMICAQIVGMHAATMECLSRSMVPNNSGDASIALRKSAANMSRTLIELLGALDRKRGKSGQQTVTVEHVHVHQGGQAIVGTIAPGSRGGGEEQPRESVPRLAHEVTIGSLLPAVWGEDPKRAVPVAGDGERPLPDAWRTIAGK
jgi:hypothetical protein